MQIGRVWLLFLFVCLSFSCLIVSVCILNTKLKRSGERGHHWLIPHCSEIQVFPHLGCWTWVSHILLFCWDMFPTVLLCRIPDHFGLYFEMSCSGWPWSHSILAELLTQAICYRPVLQMEFVQWICTGMIQMEFSKFCLKPQVVEKKMNGVWAWCNYLEAGKRSE